MVELRLARRVSPATSAALECAIFDVVAKAAGVPVWKLAGAAETQAVRCNATLTAGTSGRVRTGGGGVGPARVMTRSS